MANTDTYPVFSGSNWWKLRNKFKTAYPKIPLTDEYLASVLDMKIESIKNNGILLNLRVLGLLDEENKCTELANKWRLDETYPDACKEILEKVYPQELINIGTERNSIITWFMNKTGAGSSFANKCTALYLIITSQEIKDAKNVTKSTTKTAPKTTKSKMPEKTNSKPIKRDVVENNDVQIHKEDIPSLPSMNINLQIHISSEASPEQIDQIFFSMSRHLYGRK